MIQNFKYICICCFCCLYMTQSHTHKHTIHLLWVFFFCYQLYGRQIKPQFWISSEPVFAKLCVCLRFTYCWWRTEGCSQTCRGRQGRKRARKTSGREREVRCVSPRMQRQKDRQETEERRQEFMLDGSRHDLQEDTPLFQIQCWRLAKHWESRSREAGLKRMPTF